MLNEAQSVVRKVYGIAFCFLNEIRLSKVPRDDVSTAIILTNGAPYSEAIDRRLRMPYK